MKKAIKAAALIILICTSLSAQTDPPQVIFSPPVQFMDDWAIYTLADWEGYPNLFTITISNQEESTVRWIFMEMEVSVFGSADPSLPDGVIGWGVTHPNEIPPGGTVVYRNDSDFKYNQLMDSDYSEEFEDAVLNTGNTLPAGTYRYTFRLLYDENTPPNHNNALDLSQYYSEALSTNDVVITNPNDPELVSPGEASEEGVAIYETNPTFQFLSAGANAGATIFYSLKICNKQEGQSNDEAMDNLPFFDLSWEEAIEHLESGIITPIVYPYPSAGDNFYNGKYVWQVYARSERNMSDPSAGFSGESEIYCFQYGDIPQAIMPPDGAEITSLTPTFSWTMALGADGYLVRIGDSEDPSLESTYYEEETSATFLNHVPGGIELIPGETYYWKVKAMPYGYWSDILSFTCVEEGGLDMGVALTIIPNPLNPLRPTFVWNIIPGALSYHLYVGDEAEILSAFWDLNTISNNVEYPEYAPLLEFGGIYYAWVQPLDNEGEPITELAPPVVFEIELTEGEGLGEVVAFISPVEETIYSVTPLFAWQPFMGAAYYVVQLFENEALTSPLWTSDPVPGNSMRYPQSGVPELSFGEDYYWTIIAFDHTNFEIAGSGGAERFSIASAIPEPIYPVGETVDNLSPNFSWIAVPGVNKYKIEVAESAQFSTILWCNSEILSTSVNYPSVGATALEFERTYYWRVTSLSSTGDPLGASSNPVSFSTPSGEVEFELIFGP